MKDENDLIDLNLSKLYLQNIQTYTLPITMNEGEIQLKEDE